MKQFALILLCFVYCNGNSQELKEQDQFDTIVRYYNSGKVLSKTILKNNVRISMKAWFEDGDVMSNIVWKNECIVFEESYFPNKCIYTKVNLKGSKLHTIVWSPDGKINWRSKDSFKKSSFKQYDSTGVLNGKTISKNGVGDISCVDISTIEKSDMICFSSLGVVHQKDSIWIDSLGRDVSSKYSFIQTEYFPNGKKKIKRRKLKGSNIVFIREWNNKGKLIRKDYEYYHRSTSITM